MAACEQPLCRVWFQGATDMEQLSLIFNTLGVPDESTWPGVSQLKTYVPFKKKVGGSHDVHDKTMDAPLLSTGELHQDACANPCR